MKLNALVRQYTRQKGRKHNSESKGGIKFPKYDLESSKCLALGIIDPLHNTPREEGDALICYEALRKKQSVFV